MDVEVRISVTVVGHLGAGLGFAIAMKRTSNLLSSYEVDVANMLGNMLNACIHMQQTQSEKKEFVFS